MPTWLNANFDCATGSCLTGSLHMVLVMFIYVHSACHVYSCNIVHAFGEQDKATWSHCNCCLCVSPALFAYTKQYDMQGKYRYCVCVSFYCLVHSVLCQLNCAHMCYCAQMMLYIPSWCGSCVVLPDNTAYSVILRTVSSLDTILLATCKLHARSLSIFAVHAPFVHKVYV